MTNEESIKYQKNEAWFYCEQIISLYGHIIDLAKRIGIKPTKKFARRLKYNTMKRDNKNKNIL